MPIGTMNAMDAMPPTANIKTRFIIVSDTHGVEFDPSVKPPQRADVAIHCGDLTEASKIAEYRATIQLLNDINAPLKLVIAGNHDLTMDIPLFKQKLSEARPPLDLDLVRKEYGDYGEARQLFEQAKDAGIIFLDEGIYQFTLDNGASLTVYASPYTPSLGDWAFQYPRRQGHDFSISEGVDVVITHGPPRGILDYTDFGQRAGCPSLFSSIARARPRLHCFGHIHEAWGARLISWRKKVSENPTHFTEIDCDKSVLVENLSSLHARKGESHARELACQTSHCTGDTNPIERGAQTLFVNASVQDTSYCPVQLPWLVDIELARAG